MLNRFHWRKVPAVTLASELRRLELLAGQACTASSVAYERSQVAEQAGIQKDTLASWIDGRRTPQDLGKLLQVASALAALSGQAPPVDSDWQKLWASSRKVARDRRGAESQEDTRSRRVALWLAGTVAAAMIAGFFTPLGGEFGGWLGIEDSPAASPAGSASEANAEDGLHASAAWCCKFTETAAVGGFYWPETADSLDAALSPSKTTSPFPSLTPAGEGIIEIPLQTKSSDPIYVSPPKIIVRSCTQNVKSGIVAALPLAGQGEAPASEFSANVDSRLPTTVAYGASTSSGSPSDYYYVSSGSPEILILRVTDSDHDCMFDVKLTWKEQGINHATVLTNTGRAFHMLGSGGLPWYTGNPSLGVKLRHVGGANFLVYAS